MDDNFYKAFFPGEAKVCGRKLRDFSCFHYLTLSAINSPVISGTGVIRPGDLLAAVSVCRTSFTHRPSMKPGLHDALWKRRMERNARLFKKQARTFIEWMRVHSSRPKYWDTVIGAQPTRPLSGAQILIVVTRLIKDLGYSETEAWDMSFGRAQWMIAEAAELDGSEAKFLFDGDVDQEVSDA